MSIERIAVLGAGQMGNGITQVAACAGYNVTMIDIKQDFVDNGMATISKSLAKLVAKERMTQIDADAALSRISSSIATTSLTKGFGISMRFLMISWSTLEGMCISLVIISAIISPVGSQE